MNGTSIGAVRAFIGHGMNIKTRFEDRPDESGTIDSFVVGDSVVLWYDENGLILESLPPVYPVTRVEIIR